jgi:hypothetical protein
MELTAQLAVLFLPLDRMSDTRGKDPYLHTQSPEKAKLLGTWRTSFEQRGFFTKVIFDVELTAAEQPPSKELGRFDYLTFTFDSKELAEQFNAAFRRAFKICSEKQVGPGQFSRRACQQPLTALILQPSRTSQLNLVESIDSAEGKH